MEPLDPLRTLRQFTPTMGLNRDELMFAAGHAAGQSRWPWRSMVLGLAITQLVTLVWLYQVADGLPRQTAVPVVVPAPIEAPASSTELQENSILWLQQRPAAPTPTPSLDSQVIAQQGPVLTAWAPVLLP